MNYYDCPVCGYDKMIRPAASGYICPCCGVEFELDDDELSHAELRRLWIRHGMDWFSRATLPPVGWNPIEQLKRAGYEADLAEMYNVAVEETEDYKKDYVLVQYLAFVESDLKKYSATAAA